MTSGRKTYDSGRGRRYDWLCRGRKKVSAPDDDVPMDTPRPAVHSQLILRLKVKMTGSGHSIGALILKSIDGFPSSRHETNITCI